MAPREDAVLALRTIESLDPSQGGRFEWFSFSYVSCCCNQDEPFCNALTVNTVSITRITPGTNQEQVMEILIAVEKQGHFAADMW
jgi:hypothetical protein